MELYVSVGTISWPSLLCWSLSSRIDDLFRIFVRGKKILKIRFITCLPAVGTKRTIKTVYNHQHASRIISVHSSSIWNILRSCAPAVFQRTMDNLLKGIKHVSVYIDDIVVTGVTEEEHIKYLDEAQSAGWCWCSFKKGKVHIFLTSSWIFGSPHWWKWTASYSEQDQKAIIDAPVPSTVTELKSFLGLLNYYCKFYRTSPQPYILIFSFTEVY